MGSLKVAIIGCGAVGANAHLGTAAACERIRVTALVDRSLSRARELAAAHDVPIAVEDYRSIIGEVDAAIVALPHHLHGAVTTDLLRNRVHVLVEKPMALTTRECDQMIEAARESGVVLAVGLVRRFYLSSRFVKAVVESGLLGEIVGFDVREGMVYNWPVASDFIFRKEAGGGVLADTGAHALDVLLWWLGGFERVEYYDDAMGGVEADCELHLQLRSGASGIVELSRTRDLRNSYVIRGELGTLEVQTNFNPRIRLTVKGRDLSLAGHVAGSEVADRTVRDVFRRQLDDFVNAVLDHREPFVPGEEGKRAVALIEACHASPQPLKYPWIRSIGA